MRFVILFTVSVWHRILAHFSVTTISAGTFAAPRLSYLFNSQNAYQLHLGTKMCLYISHVSCNTQNCMAITKSENCVIRFVDIQRGNSLLRKRSRPFALRDEVHALQSAMHFRHRVAHDVIGCETLFILLVIWHWCAACECVSCRLAHVWVRIFSQYIAQCETMKRTLKSNRYRGFNLYIAFWDIVFPTYRCRCSASIQPRNMHCQRSSRPCDRNCISIGPMSKWRWAKCVWGALYIFAEFSELLPS